MKTAVNSRIYLEKGTGIPNYVACLYRKCLELDPRNEFVFFQPNRSRTLGPTEVAPAPAGQLGAALFDTLRVHRLIRRFRPDVFHGPSHVLPLRKCNGVKYVVTIHDLAIRLLPSLYSRQLRWYYRFQFPHALRMADAVIAVSHNTKRDIIRVYRVPENRVHVIHLGVDDRFLRLPEQSHARLIPERYFLSVTTHPRRKNIPAALNAFAKLTGKDRLKYVIVGMIDDSQRRELYAQADELGIRDRVVVFGYADDDQLRSLYRNAESLVYPSLYEGFGLPVLEAMACGCPVIAANSSSLPEVMPGPDWLADPRDPDDIAARMRLMLSLSNERRSEIIGQNRRHAGTFTWENAARKTMELFKGLQEC